MEGSYGQFEVFLIDQARDFDLRGADHDDIDPFAGQQVKHFAATPEGIEAEQRSNTDGWSISC